MKIKTLFCLCFVILVTENFSFADIEFSFEGQIDFLNHQLDLTLNFPTLGNSQTPYYLNSQNPVNKLDNPVESAREIQNDQAFALKENLSKIETKMTENSITATTKKISENNYQVLLNIERLKTPIFNLSSEMQSSIEVLKGKNGIDQFISGKIWSQYSLVDYKPIRELNGQFEIRDKKLFLSSLTLGDIDCRGYIDLIYPYKLDLTLFLNAINMDDFLSFWVKNKSYDSSGDVSGEIQISGTLDRLLLKGNLESFDGFFKDFKYDSIVLNIEGIYPNMEIAHSAVSETDSLSFTIDGRLNLSDRENFEKQIKSLKISPLVSDSERELEWTIRRLKPRDSSSSQIKYLLKKKIKGADPSAGEESDMLGIERTTEF